MNLVAVPSSRLDIVTVIGIVAESLAARGPLASMLQDASPLRRGLVILAGIQGIRGGTRPVGAALSSFHPSGVPQLHPRHSAAPVKPL